MTERACSPCLWFLRKTRPLCAITGEHGNAELINKYGFAVPDNPFDAVQLDKDALMASATESLGEEGCQQRCSFLNAHRCATVLWCPAAAAAAAVSCFMLVACCCCSILFHACCLLLLQNLVSCMLPTTTAITVAIYVPLLL